MARKFIVLLLALLVIFPLLSLPVSANTSSLSSGTLIKSTTYPDVYYLGADGKRYVFPDQKTYQSWYISFKGIISISQSELTNLPLGGTVTYKPGARLIKMKTDPKVYYVDINATLRYVPSESLAKELWGLSWSQLVDDMSESLYPLYHEGSVLDSSSLSPATPEYSINQEKNLSDEPNPVTNKEIILSKSVSGTTVNLSWQTNFTSSQGFKIVKADHVNPVYPGDDYHYLSDSAVRADSWEGLSAGTYHFRVCEYLGSSCGAYSNDITVTIAGTSTDTGNKTITVTKSISGNTVNLSWITNFTSSMGFKIVKADHVNPVYPGDDYHYLSDPAVRADSWEGLSAGTYHFRVCEYLGGSCGTYSNDITVLVSGTQVIKSITLSASSNIYGVYLNWTTNFTSANGYKIIKAEHVNPIYPGDDYYYSSDPNTLTYNWKNLNDGIYHFRVCEYIDGACGTYSNDVTVTVTGNPTTKLITLSAVGGLNGATLSWTRNFLPPEKGYMTLIGTSVNPSYPNDQFDQHNFYEGTGYSLVAGTYHIRLCEWLGNGCGTYSNDVMVTVTNSPDAKIIMLRTSTIGNNVTLNWNYSFSAPQGFVTLMNYNSINYYPNYPTDKAHELTIADTNTDSFNNLSAGTYHFRVCQYLDGVCFPSSNFVTIIIP